MREFLLIGHLFGVFILLAGLGVGTTLGLRSQKVNDVKTLKWMMDTLLFNGRAVVTSGMVLAIGFGIALVSETGHEMSESWISAAFLLSFVSLGLLHGVVLKGVREVAANCDELLAAGTSESTDHQGSALGKKLALAGMATNVGILVMLWLMVAQPGA